MSIFATFHVIAETKLTSFFRDRNTPGFNEQTFISLQ